jgi:hypothetical protein
MTDLYSAEDSVIQIKSHSVIIGYYTAGELRKLTAFKFPDGSVPIIPRIGEVMMFPERKPMIITNVVHAFSQKDGVYTHYVNLVLEDENSSAISLN